MPMGLRSQVDLVVINAVTKLVRAELRWPANGKKSGPVWKGSAACAAA
jgi:hypothetical protein